MTPSTSSSSPLAFLKQWKSITSKAGGAPPPPAGKGTDSAESGSAAGGLHDLNLDFSDLTPEPAPAQETRSAGISPSAADRARAVLNSQGQPPVATVNGSGPTGSAKPDSGASSTGAAVSPPGESAGTHESALPHAPPTAYLNELFDRVSTLLSAAPEHFPDGFVPREPESFDGLGLSSEEVERLILKFLLARGNASGRRIAQQICLPFNLVEPMLKQFKFEQMVGYKGSATMGDYEYTLTEIGRERARRYVDENTYFGACPVTLKDYLTSMAAQSIAKQHATEVDLQAAFADIIINRRMLEKLGPAINSGRGMFLFGEPGNGKSTIAERITACFGTSIYIPRAISIDGDILRIYDPAVHQPIEESNEQEGLFNLSGVDARWIKIRRPTVIVGGELTMAELEVKQNTTTKICEAPLQLKSNCGTLVIDDFGRQRMPVSELLNRWIVPLEKRYDFLNMPSGKKIQVPFDQIIVFSTNLEPKDLVDGAFLRRIPYKIQVLDPTPDEFHQLFERIAPTQGFQYDRSVVEYLLERHYRPVNRPLRSCQPRDLLLQVRNYCMYHGLPKVMTRDAFDFAVENYFSVM